MERFAYVASHDLQEPLRMVSNYIQLLERRYKDIVDNDGREFIGYAVEGAKRMQSMIKDLLVFSRAGSRPLELKKTSLESVAAQAIKNLQETVSEKGAVINTYNLPFVECDEMQMIQLFQNILDNALKFSKKGTTPVIEIKSEKKEGSYIISFRDNGIGIEKKYHDKIFVIFNRLHSRQEYPGSGIGLAVCKKIAEKHKGRITVDSEPGSGSVFSLILPENISDNKQV